MEQDLDDLVAVAEQNGLPCALPLLDVAQWKLRSGSLWRSILLETEFQRLELGVSVQVAFEVLQEDDLLVDALGVLEEVVLGDVVLNTFSVCTSRSSAAHDT